MDSRPPAGRTEEQLEKAEPAGDARQFTLLPPRIQRLLTSFRFWFLICGTWAGALGWAGRHSINADGVSYIEMASNALRDGPQHLVSCYWSPLYPALISLAFLLFRPAPSLELPVIHLLNWLVFMLVTMCFAFFARSLLRRHDTQGADPAEGGNYLLPFAFGLFLWSTTYFVPFAMVTPDLCVAGAVFLAGAICCRLSDNPSKTFWYCALGVVLGLGYYAKAVMFPLAVLLLTLLFIWSPNGTAGRFRVLLAASVFLLVSAPLIFLLSNRLGRLSTGEAGSLNYAWFVNKARPDLNRALPHPARTLMDRPRIVEFESAVRGTFPLHYDPSYWNEGVKPRFDLKQQGDALRANLWEYEKAASKMIGLCAGALVLGFRALLKRPLLKVNSVLHWLLLWPIAACALYALVHVEFRFLSAFAVLFWLALYACLCQPSNRSAQSSVVATVLLCLLIPMALDSPGIARDLFQGARGNSKPSEHEIVSEGLKLLGLKPGDRLANVGKSYGISYGARLAGLRIIAEIPAEQDFWLLSNRETAAVKERLRSIGVKALVALNRPGESTQEDWRPIPKTRFSVLLLQPPEHAPVRSESAR